MAENTASTHSRSAQRTLELLLAFSEYRLTATVTELAEVVGTPVPTTYRYVRLLKDMHILEEGAVGRYHPTAKVMAIARAAQLSNGIGKIAAPIIRDAVEQLGESVLLMQTVGADAVCIEGTECSKRMRFAVDRGHTMRLGHGATGKMSLAMMPEADRNRWITHLKFSDATLTEVEQAEADGFAISEGEIDVGTFACSVPVAMVDGRPVVITLAGPAPRIPEEQRPSVVAALQKSASEIARLAQDYAL